MEEILTKPLHSIRKNLAAAARKIIPNTHQTKHSLKATPDHESQHINTLRRLINTLPMWHQHLLQEAHQMTTNINVWRAFDIESQQSSLSRIRPHRWTARSWQLDSQRTRWLHSSAPPSNYTCQTLGDSDIIDVNSNG